MGLLHTKENTKNDHNFYLLAPCKTHVMVVVVFVVIFLFFYLLFSSVICPKKGENYLNSMLGCAMCANYNHY